MAERIRNMRAATNLSKDSPTQKRKALIEVSPIPFDEDENTNLGLIFKRKRREFAALNTPTRMRFLHGTDLKVAKEQLKQVITEATGEKEFPDSSSDFRAIEASYHRDRFYAFKASLRVASTLSASFFLLRCCSCNYIHYDVTSSFPHLGHSGIVEAARELFMQIEGNPERLVSIRKHLERNRKTSSYLFGSRLLWIIRSHRTKIALEAAPKRKIQLVSYLVRSIRVELEGYHMELVPALLSKDPQQG
ncbi:uncharacterized protein [Phaseolus vulgaris]|uniref:uncharacterized protein n=1 Tax=Phaseolus vulgaris TaxID=3885 RepID=UPI0035CC836B